MKMDRLSLLLLPVYVFATLVYGDPIVQTDSGPIQGKTVASCKVAAYLGIPYAEPPVGRLRFAKPVPKTSWDDVYDATQLPPACVQMDLKIPFLTPDLSDMSEDCLYLNVWVPSATTDDGKLKAVMFFIHGGGFMTGSSNMGVYDGYKLAEIGDVVVVTINYRVGVLGFYAGQTKDIPGNQGLHDQVLALQWIKANARHFHGDPDNIVIFGESAGAFSVSLHQISPSSRNLFKRAILQSGSAINPLYTVGNQKTADINAMYTRELGCDIAANQDPDDAADCLRKIPVQALAEADMTAQKQGTFVLLPRFGDELFSEGAVSMFREGQFKDTEVLMGINRDEGSMGVYYTHTNLKDMMDNKKGDFFNRTTAFEAIQSNSWTRALLELSTPEESERIVQGYLDDVIEESEYDYVSAVSDAFGDTLITCGAVFQAEYHSAGKSPVYFYMFGHRTSNSPYPEWMGVPHFEEVPYVFGNPLHLPFTDREEELSRDIMDMWTSFAKTGNPNIPGGLQWPPFTLEDPKYYVIGMRDWIDTRPDKHRCERWRNIFLKSHK